MASDPIPMPELENSLAVISEQFVEEMRDRLFEQDAVVTGNLAKSIFVKEIEQRGYVLRSRIELLEYGEYVDSGAKRGPGRMPPLKPILDWIKLKSIKVPQGFTKESFAFAIQRSIGKKGQRFKKPKPFIQVSLNDVLARNLDEDTLAKAAAMDFDNSIVATANQAGLKATP